MSHGTLGPMDRNFGPAGNNGPIPPVYLSAAQITGEAMELGTFQNLGVQPPTSLRPESITMLFEELRNLVIGLGGTPAPDIDTQLRDLLLPLLVQGVAAPAEWAYTTTPDARFVGYADEPNGERAKVESGGLVMREPVAGAANTFALEVPSGWDGGANVVVSVPPAAYVPDNVEMAMFALGTWIPSVGGGLATPSYPGVRDGIYQRIGHIVHVSFRVEWSGATPSGSAVTLTGLPYGTTGNARGLTVQDAQFSGTAQLGAGSGALYSVKPRPSPSDALFYNSAGTVLNGTTATAAGFLYGSFWYWVNLNTP